MPAVTVDGPHAGPHGDCDKQHRHMHLRCTACPAETWFILDPDERIEIPAHAWNENHTCKASSTR